MALYDPQQHRALAFRYGHRPRGLLPLLCWPVPLWLLGYPDQARTQHPRGADPRPGAGAPL